jgi:hypothetical protein
MSQVLVTDQINASANAVWLLVSDFGGIKRWNGAVVQDISVEGKGIGAVRSITLPGDMVMQERLEKFDSEGRSFSYAIVGKSPLPVSDYLATLTIFPDGGSRCRVEWGSTFECGDFPEAQAIPMIESIYKNGIIGIKQVLED